MNYFERKFGTWFGIQIIINDENENENCNEMKSKDENKNENEIEKDNENCILPINMVNILNCEPELRYCFLMLRYLLSRICSNFDGIIENNETFSSMNRYMLNIMQLLLQLHCYKTLNNFIIINENNNNKTKIRNTFSIELMCEWVIWGCCQQIQTKKTWVEHRINDNLSKFIVPTQGFMEQELLNLVSKAYTYCNKPQLAKQCENVHSMFSAHTATNVGDSIQNQTAKQTQKQKEKQVICQAINLNNLEICPICQSVAPVDQMHSSQCGYQSIVTVGNSNSNSNSNSNDNKNDKQFSEKHLLARCCIGYQIIHCWNRWICQCCNGCVDYTTIVKLIHMDTSHQNMFRDQLILL